MCRCRCRSVQHARGAGQLRRGAPGCRLPGPNRFRGRSGAGQDRARPGDYGPGRALRARGAASTQKSSSRSSRSRSSSRRRSRSGSSPRLPREGSAVSGWDRVLAGAARALLLPLQSRPGRSYGAAAPGSLGVSFVRPDAGDEGEPHSRRGDPAGFNARAPGGDTRAERDSLWDGAGVGHAADAGPTPALVYAVEPRSGGARWQWIRVLRGVAWGGRQGWRFRVSRGSQCRGDRGEHGGAGQQYERHDMAALSGADRAGCCADAAACRRLINAREQFVSLTRRPPRGHHSRAVRKPESQNATREVSRTRPV